MKLRPSEIRFSQDSISNTFDQGYTAIGSLVKDVCSGITSISDIPKIQVAKVDGNWVTLDNRRLWVFQELQNRGRCSEIEVIEVSSVPSSKHTSTNGGVSVHVRGNPYVAPGRSTRRRYSDSDSDFLFDSDSDNDCW